MRGGSRFWPVPKPHGHARHAGSGHDGDPRAGAGYHQHGRAERHEHGGAPFGPSADFAALRPILQQRAEEAVIPQPAVKPWRASRRRPCGHEDEHGGRQAGHDDPDDAHHQAQYREGEQQPPYGPRQRAQAGRLIFGGLGWLLGHGAIVNARRVAHGVMLPRVRLRPPPQPVSQPTPMIHR